MKVGITGSDGVLGTILVKKIKEKGYKYNCFEGDITNIGEIRKWVLPNDFDSIVHLAAIVPPTEVRKDLIKAFDVYSIGTKNLTDVLIEKSPDIWLFTQVHHTYINQAKNLFVKITQ